MTAAGTRLEARSSKPARHPYEGSGQQRTTKRRRTHRRQVFGLAGLSTGPVDFLTIAASQARAPSALWQSSFPFTAAGQSRIHAGFPFNPARQETVRRAPIAIAATTEGAGRCQQRCETVSRVRLRTAATRRSYRPPAPYIRPHLRVSPQKRATVSHRTPADLPAPRPMSSHWPHILLIAKSSVWLFVTVVVAVTVCPASIC